jgi:hypothetical protein
MMDYPGQGRSANIPGVDGTLLPPRSGPLMEEVWSGGRPASTPQSSWLQAKKYSQWPSNAPNKGKMGDPVFDYFAKTELQQVSSPDFEKRTVDALEQLLDTIGQPVVLMLNSGIAASGWVVADARSKLVKGHRRSRAGGSSPCRERGKGRDRSGRVWGVSNLPIHYDPRSRRRPTLRPVREDKADGPTSSLLGFNGSLRTSS